MKTFHKSTLSLALVAALSGTAAQADSLVPLHGRVADMSTLFGLSVEGGVRVFDNLLFSGRVNYGLSESLVLVGDLGFVDLGFGFGDDGLLFGGGAYYQLPAFVEGFDSAIYGGYHLVASDIDYSTITVELLASPSVDLSTDTGLNLYANIGFRRGSYEVDNFYFNGRSRSFSDTDLLLGGGATLPVGPGEAYVGLDLIGGFSAGAGYRVYFN